jgi:hypothetical protein
MPRDKPQAAPTARARVPKRGAIRSTGPRTEEGKRQTRRNLSGMGCARKPSSKFAEDIEDYRAAFEAAVIANYDAQTAVERELVPWTMTHPAGALGYCRWMKVSKSNGRSKKVRSGLVLSGAGHQGSWTP